MQRLLDWTGVSLSGPGPFTVFAPTDKAFAALPPGTLDNLLKNKTALTGRSSHFPGIDNMYRSLIQSLKYGFFGGFLQTYSHTTWSVAHTSVQGLYQALFPPWRVKMSTLRSELVNMTLQIHPNFHCIVWYVLV